MVPRARLCLGEGARCSVLVKYLRPSKAVADAIVNPVAGQRLDDLIAVKREMTMRNGKEYFSIFYQSETIPGVLLSSAERWAVALEQGPGHLLWDADGVTAGPTGLPPVLVTNADQGEEIAEFIFNAQNRAEDIALVRNMGFEVDDDNEPAPENVPTNNAPRPNGGNLYEGQEWGWDGIDRRAMMQGSMYNDPKFTNDWTPQGKDYIEIFLHLFPLHFLEAVIVQATNNALLAADNARTTVGEMLRYIGMWMLMSCYLKSPAYFWRSTAMMGGTTSEDEENDTPSLRHTVVHLQPIYVAAPL
jgi:hypothetical protein